MVFGNARMEQAVGSEHGFSVSTGKSREKLAEEMLAVIVANSRQVIGNSTFAALAAGPRPPTGLAFRGHGRAVGIDVAAAVA